MKAQATALVAEQRRAQEQAEYKAHADAILKLQATQQAHLRAQEEAHRQALNFEKNQIRAQAQAQAIANAQALALYQAQQQARAKAQKEAQSAAKSQAEAGKIDPEHTPVVQYLLPNSVPLPPPEVYLPKAQKLLEAAAQQQQLEQHQQHAIHRHQQAHLPRPKQLAVLVEQPVEDLRAHHLIRLPVASAGKAHLQHEQPAQLTRDDLALLVNAGYALIDPQTQQVLVAAKKHRPQPYIRPTQAEFLAYQETGPVVRS